MCWCVARSSQESVIDGCAAQRSVQLWDAACDVRGQFH